MDPHFAMKLIGLIFDTQSPHNAKILLCVDDFKNVPDPVMRQKILRSLVATSTIYPKTLIFATSRDPTVFAYDQAGFHSPVVKCPYTAPVSIVKSKDVWPVLKDGKKTDLVPFILDSVDIVAPDDQHFSKDDLEDYVTCLESRIDNRLNRNCPPFTAALLDSKNCGPLPSLKVKEAEMFVNTVFNGYPVLTDNEQTIKFFELGLYKNYHVPAMLNGLGKLTKSERNIMPLASYADVVTAILLHLSVIDGSNPAAWWALLICLVPFKQGDSDTNMKLLFLFNECRARQARYYRGNHFEYIFSLGNYRSGTYFGLFENLYNLDSANRHDSDFDICAKTSYTVKYRDSDELDQLLKNCKRIAGLVKADCYDPLRRMAEDLEKSDSLLTKAPNTKAKQCRIPEDILSMMTDNAIRYFCEGGTFVLNSPSPAGYDYATVDGKTLNFYSIKLPTKYSSKLISIEVLDTMAFCERVFSAIKQRMIYLGIDNWRLIINSLRPVDVSKEQLPNNVIIMDQEQCFSMLPPTIANRVALDCGSDPESIIDKCESEYLKMAREREDSLRACRQ